MCDINKPLPNFSLDETDKMYSIRLHIKAYSEIVRQVGIAPREFLTNGVQFLKTYAR